MTTQPIEFTLDNEILVIHSTQYHDGCTAIQIRAKNGEPYATLSVHMPDRHPEAGTFYLKDWSENASIAEYLKTLGFVKPLAGPIALSGDVFAEIHTLSEANLDCQCDCKCGNRLATFEDVIGSFGICNECDYCGPRHGCDHPAHPNYRPNWPN